MPDINKFFRILDETKEVAYDVETNGLDWKSCHICGYSVSDGKDSEYIPVRHGGGANISDVSRFEHSLDKSITKHPGKIIGWNTKFDMHFSENHKIKFGNKVVDGMVYEALLNENKRSYALKNCLKEHGIEHKSDKALYEHIAQQFGCEPNRDSMGHYHRLAGNDPLAVAYACDDTRCTKLRYEQQKKEIYAQQLDLVADIENQLTYVLQKMERRGIIVDPDECIKVKKEVQELYANAYGEITPIVDEFGLDLDINVRSKKNLQEYFETCEITDWPMTAPTQRFPNGQPSFNKQYLQTTKEGLNILNVRKYLHLINSFLDPIDRFIHNNKIHTTFNQTRGESFHGTRSGRLSSSYPNMQQVPKRDEELGKIYRRMFMPLRDYVLIEYDYSQAEPRLYAHYSGEPTLLEGYNKTPFIDMHSIAAEYMGVSRGIAKNLNLGIMYTMGAEKLSIQLGISYDEALFLLKKWHKTFPYVSAFTRKASKVVEQRLEQGEIGYVKTILGRRSRFDNIRFSYRAANRIIQGGSADILKYKLVEIDRYLVNNNLEEVCQMLLNIHDSILFMIHKDYLHLVPEIKNIMERTNAPPFNLRVPFVAEYKQGNNWSEATYGETI